MLRTFVLGSCVSRDALEQVPGAVELVGYIARTSMASIGMPAIGDPEVRQAVSRLPSAFQRRMLFNDLDKTTVANLMATPHDVLLVDFIDERFNLLRSGASLFSFSGELEQAGLRPGDREVVAPGSEAFLALWLAGFERLLAAVDASKIVLNRAYWATHFPDGEPVSSMGWIRNNNAMLKALYDAVDARWSLRCIDYPDDLVLADRTHRWGIAPYHYAQPFYEHTIGALRDNVAATTSAMRHEASPSP